MISESSIAGDDEWASSSYILAGTMSVEYKTSTFVHQVHEDELW